MFSRDSRAQSSDHRWGGLVSDTFALETSAGIRAWSAEDGGRIRARNPATGGWQFQVTPTEVQDTLHRTFFLAGGEVGWAVGNGGWLLKTTNGGINWNVWARFPAQIVFLDPWEELYDVHFLDENHGWLVGTHSVWLTTNGGQGSWRNVLSVNRTS